MRFFITSLSSNMFYQKFLLFAFFEEIHIIKFRLDFMKVFSIFMNKYEIKMLLRYVFWIVVIILVCCVAFYRCYFLRQPYRKVPNDVNLFVSPDN